LNDPAKAYFMLSRSKKRSIESVPASYFSSAEKADALSPGLDYSKFLRYFLLPCYGKGIFTQTQILCTLRRISQYMGQQHHLHF
jgi:hypothetical protein